MKTILVENLAAELAEMAARMESASLAEPLRDCVQPVRDGFSQNFSAAASSTNSPWPPRKDDKPHPLLIETGALLGATQGQSGAAEHISDRTLQLGVDKSVDQGGIPGAAVHNFGYPPRNIPQREYLYANETTLDICQEIIGDGAYTEFFVF